MTLTFRIQIKNITKPPVWRRIEIPAEYNFHQFHTAIQLAFGWTFDHLYQFQERAYDSEWTITVKRNDEDDFFSFFTRTHEIEAKETNVFKFLMSTHITKFVYVYDFGDDWIHEVKVEDINPTENLKFPRCLAGKGKCPPEDCGGPWGYEHLKDFIDNHPKSEEASEMLEWLDDIGYDYDPKYFDLEAINSDLKEVDNCGKLGPDLF